MLLPTGLLIALARAGAQDVDASQPMSIERELAGQSADDDALHFGSWRVHGEAVFGSRAVHVDGSQAQFDEASNVDSGPVVRAFSLSGEPTDAGSRSSWSIGVFGIGDPQTSARAELDTGDVRAIARYDRSVFVGNTDGDLHRFDMTHESASLQIESSPAASGALHAGLEATFGHRDGFTFGTRSVDFGFVSNVATHNDTRTFGLRGNMSGTLGGFELQADAGAAHLDTRDRRNFSEPSPSDPNSLQTEDYRSDGNGTSLDGGLRLAREFDGGQTRIDCGARAAGTDGDGVVHSIETGIQYAPQFPIYRQTDGDVDLTASSLSFDAGVRRELSDGCALLARLSRRIEHTRGDLERTIVLNPIFDPPPMLVIPDTTRFESRLDLAEVGFEIALSDSCDLTATLEAGHEELFVEETSFAVELRHFDGAKDRAGGELSLEWRPSRPWSITCTGGAGVAPTGNSLEGTGFGFADDHTLFASLRARYQPGASLTLTASARHQDSERDAFDSTSVSDSLSLGISGTPARGVTADVNATWRRFDLEADALVLVLTPGPTELPDTIVFKGTQTILSGAVSDEVNEDFTPRLAASAVLGVGDGAMTFEQAALDLPLRIAKSTWIGAEFDVQHFDGHDLTDASDYSAVVALVYCRTGF